MLAAIAVLVAGGGTVLFWMSGVGDAEPMIEAGQIGDLCELVVDEELIGPWADAEQARESNDGVKDEVRTFDCAYSAEHSGDEAYRLVTFFAQIQVYESTSDARAAHAGVLDFEESSGNQTSDLSGVADKGATAVIDDGQETELRFHLQEANSTVSINFFLTGSPPEGADKEQLARDLASGLIDALPRDGN